MPVVLVNGKQKQYEKGTTFETIAQEFQATLKAPAVLVNFNGKLRELNRKLDRDGYITLITTADSAGFKAYSRTAEMMLIKAVDNILRKNSTDPAAAEDHVRIEFALGNGIFCTVKAADVPIDDAFAKRVQSEMERLRDRNITITKKTYPKDDAIELFRRQGMTDKVKLFRFRRSSSINVYALDGMYDYYYGYMLPRTGLVSLFSVKAYNGGLILILPTEEHPDRIEEFQDQKSLFEQLTRSTEWGKLVDVNTVGDLNEKVCARTAGEVILVQEALQERRIGEIGRMIYEKDKVRFVLVAGPSSSGKTTFAHRLSIQLRSFGLHPHIISMDDYFVNRDKTPIDIDGNYNYDVLEALDVEQLNEDMNALLEGETVQMPSYDFKTGKRVYKGNTLSLGENDILIMEGIHGLNPKCTQDLDDSCKFRIYISAMTSLNIDGHNRVPSTDVRLLRRIVRDARTRGNSARDTLEMWKKVRASEDVNIFPYQDGADVVFNSTLDYELSVLKQHCEPLLFNVPSDSKEYQEAKRLLKFLDYFIQIDDAYIPIDSLCREFIGGGCFDI